MQKIATPFFSIITCTRNSEKYIAQNIDSVRKQSYKNFEHIVIDGHSQDGTLPFLKSIQKEYPHLRIYTAVPRGISDALNTGIQYSTGRYIIHLNSDDYFHSRDVLSQVAQLLHDRPRIEVLYGKIQTIEDNTTPIGVFPRYSLLQLANPVVLRYFNFVPHQATFVHKSVFKKYGVFDNKLVANMDYDFWLRIISHTQWQFIDLIISNYRVRSGAQSSSKDNKKINAQHLRVVLSRHLTQLEVVVVEFFNIVLARLYKMSR
jgi:glycosyltransferase involved in cell wall biosynthesis